MPVLKGLDGISKNEIEALFIYHHSDISVILKNGYAATSAGNCGAINIWLDDKDKVRCEAMIFMQVKSSEVFDDIFLAQVWVEDWMQRIGAN